MNSTFEDTLWTRGNHLNLHCTSQLPSNPQLSRFGRY